MVAVAATAAALTIPPTAVAQVDTMDPDLLTETMRSDATYSNGNQPQPCDRACNFIRQAEREPIANETTRTGYMSDLLRLRERTGLWQKIKNTPHLYFRVALGGLATVATVGYGVNRYWVKLGWKMDPAGNAEDNFNSPGLVWSDDPVVADGNPPSGGGDLVLPGDAWHFVFRWAPSTSDTLRWLEYEDAQCNYADFPTPKGMTVITAPRPQSCFIAWDPYPFPVYADGYAHAAYTRELRVVDWGNWPPPDEQYDHSIPGGGQDHNSFEEDRDDITNELRDHPQNYPTLLPWLEYMLSGKANQNDPLGNGEQHPEIDFPKRWEKWIDHGDGFAQPYTDPDQYWDDAVDIVKRGRSGGAGGVLTCRREDDNAEIFWDIVKQAIVIVREDGKIDTYFVSDDGISYYLDQCPDP
jgi:hypothetical protein